MSRRISNSARAGGPTRVRSVPQSARGFTLIELMIVISVAGILGAVAAPAMSVFVKNASLRGTTWELVGALSLARGEAVKRGSQAVLCQRGPDVGGLPSCGGASGDWSNGWLLYLNEDTDPAFSPGSSGSGDVLLDTGSPAKPGVTLRANGVASSRLVFRSDGSLQASSSAQFVVCDPRGTDFGRQVNVTLVGRTAIMDGTRNPLASCTPSS